MKKDLERKDLKRLVMEQQEIIWNYTSPCYRAYVVSLYRGYMPVCIAGNVVKDISFFDNYNGAVQYAEIFIDECAKIQVGEKG